MKLLQIFLVLISLSLTNATAAKWEIDSDHSNIGFTVRHLMVANVSGQLSQMKGHVDLDDKDLTKTGAEVVIQTSSLSTNNAKRDTHLKSADFFDAKKFPTITFKGKKAEGASFEKFRLTGDLMMHGVTKEVVFDVESPETTTKDPWGNTRRGFTATSEINRQDFGIKWNKAMDGGGTVVSDMVKIRVDFSLMQPSSKKPKS